MDEGRHRDERLRGALVPIVLVWVDLHPVFFFFNADTAGCMHPHLPTEALVEQDLGGSVHQRIEVSHL